MIDALVCVTTHPNRDGNMLQNAFQLTIAVQNIFNNDDVM